MPHRRRNDVAARRKNVKKLIDMAGGHARRRPRDPSRYTGDLAKLLPRNRLPGEIVHRFDLLFEWHKVEKGNFERLAWALALTHVPGLSMRKKGSPSKLMRALRWCV